jgi:long-chain acyl-CoA synthetase
MTPAHFIRILEVPEAQRAQYDLSSLRLIVHGGAPCPVPVKRRIIDALPATDIWELYGASEGGATRVSPQEWLERPGTVGVPWPGVDVRILDADGRALPPGEAGLVYVAPAGGARFHYHDDPDKTSQAWRDDAFTVGDIGYLDDDGYLFLTDRVKDMVISGGENVYPAEVENVLMAHDGIGDVAVIGVPHEKWGETVMAMVVKAEGTDPTPEELIAFAKERLAGFKCPTRIEFLDALPRNPSGKILKRELREPYWAGRDRRV